MTHRQWLWDNLEHRPKAVASDCAASMTFGLLWYALLRWTPVQPCLGFQTHLLELNKKNPTKPLLFIALKKKKALKREHDTVIPNHFQRLCFRPSFYGIHRFLPHTQYTSPYLSIFALTTIPRSPHTLQHHRCSCPSSILATCKALRNYFILLQHVKWVKKL